MQGLNFLFYKTHEKYCYQQGSYILSQGFLVVKFRTFYGCHHDLVTCYEIFIYWCHKWPWICSVCRNFYPVISSFMTYNEVCNDSNTRQLPPSIFSGVHVARSLVFCVMFCISLFDPFLLAIVFTGDKLIMVTAVTMITTWRR